MSPTLEHGERILALRHWPARSLQKGLIVLVRYGDKTALKPPFPATTLYIKRVAGLGGETLIVDKDGSVAASNLHPLQIANHSNQQVWTIPKGYIFVLGDNRAKSADSRIWGPLHEKNVVGVVIMKLPSRGADASHLTVSTQTSTNKDSVYKYNGNVPKISNHDKGCHEAFGRLEDGISKNT